MIEFTKETQQQKAFTLVELLIVVAIIGILVSIAYPNYQNYVIKTRRDDAKGALLGFANAMERHFTENSPSTYCDAGGAGGLNSCGVAGTNDSGTPTIYNTTSPIDGNTPYYNLTIQPGTTQVFYNLRATPIGSQALDGLLEINSTESRGRWDRNNDGDTTDAGENTWD